MPRRRSLLVGLAVLAISAACGDSGGTGVGGAGGSAGEGGGGSAASSTTGSGASGGAGASGSGSGSSSGGGASSGTGTGGGEAGDAPTETMRLPASRAFILNPERGFYSTAELLEEDDLSWVIENGHTLVHSYVHLDDFRDQPLSEELLAAIDAAMAVPRAAGIKVILRFAYNLGPYPDPEPDAPLEQVLQHIEQLAPVLTANADVLAVLQGGFVGAWGEWHSSTHDLDEPRARQAIVQALLAAVPASRSIQLRNPVHKEAIFGGALDPAEAWTGSDEARTGHHNDCFLASETDLGTYPEGEVETWKQYVADDTRFVPMGGETCAAFPPRTECESALAEMERLHVSYLNQDYHPDVIDGWVDGECKEEMDRRIGHRLLVTSADVAPTVRPGGSFVLRVRIQNQGFAAPFNPRPLTVVVETDDQRLEATWPGVDARQLLPGDDIEIAARLRLPSDVTAGPARISLRLADPLQEDDPRYAIQLANEGTWDAASGDNLLAEIDIDDGAPGTSDPAATELALTAP
jgi:hypothetical protein